MEYMTRVYGSGSTLVAHDVRHTHSYQDQVGLCDGIKCQASGTHTAKSNISFLTGTEVPAIFEKGNATAGNRSNEGYRQPTLSLSADDYGNITIGQESTIRFTTAEAVYKTRTIKTSYKSTLELSPGDYWIDGDLDLNSQDSIVRLVNSSSASQKVRLFVSGNIIARQISLQGFSQGQIALYVRGNANFGNDFILPGEIHALGSVGFGMRARVTGGIYSNNFSTGNEAVIRYTRTDHDHYMGTLQPAFNSVFELSPGNYWINGNFVVDVSAIIRKINGPGKVRIFVNGNINLQHASSFEGFAAGELLLYATGNINIASQKDLPAFLYANGDVNIAFSGNSRFLGNIVGHNVTIGQGSVVEYQIPNNLEPFCSTTPVISTVNYHLIYPSEALTCNEISVTLEARDSKGELLTSTSTVNLSPANMWINSAKHTFTGSTIAYLRRQSGSYTLGIDHSSPVASSISCSTSDCNIRLHDSGFVLDVPNLVAGVSDLTATIEAVKTDDITQQCVPGFAGGSRNILLSSSYLNPASGALFPSINKQSVSNTAQPVPLTFDDNAKASFEIQYDDVGELTLAASYTGSGNEQGLQMSGSGNFIIRPHTLAVTKAFADSSLNPGTTDAKDSAGFIAAGTDFSVMIAALNSNGQPTPNFGKETPRQLVETHFSSLVYPLAGSDGTLTAGTVNTSLSVSDGQQQVDNVSWDEVGSIKLTASLTGSSYMGTGDVVAKPESDVIGRFYPHHFVVVSSEVKNSCQQFSYMSHNNLTINYHLQARNKHTKTLLNYHTGDYSGTAQIGVVAYDATTDLGYSRLSVNSATWQHGEYRITQTDAAFKRDNLPDGPFSNLQPGLSILSEKDNRQFLSVDLGNNSVKLDGTLDMRFGRMILKNAYGPENENLPLELNAEYWEKNLNRFVLNTHDSCSEQRAAKLNPISFVPQQPVTGASQVTASGNASQPTLINGSGIINNLPGIWLNAANQRGEGTATYQVPEWLQYNWSGNAPDNNENPAANFIFGSYRGNPRQIFWREQF